MAVGNDMFVLSVWQRLGHHIPAEVATSPCKCTAGVAAKADYSMAYVDGRVTEMRHDNLANALRPVVSTCSDQSAAERRCRTVGGKEGMVDCQRRADIVAVLMRLSLRQRMSWLRTRLRSRTLLRLPRNQGELRRGLNGPCGRGSESMSQIMLPSGLCHLRWTCGVTIT